MDEFYNQFKNSYKDGMIFKKLNESLPFSKDNIQVGYFKKSCKIDEKCKDCGLIFNQIQLNKNGLCKVCRSSGIKSNCKECGIEIKTRGKHSNLCSEHWSFKRVVDSLLASAKYRSKKLGIQFDLDFDWIKERIKTCEATGVLLEIRDCKIVETGNYSNRNPRTPTIDKIDPNKGYTKDNCRVVCWWYNLAKSIYSDKVILDLMKTTVEFNKVKNG